MTVATPGSGTTAPAIATTPPWWSTPIFHLITGAVVLLSGVALTIGGHPDIGEPLIGSGVTFLGVGAGVGLTPGGNGP